MSWAVVFGLLAALLLPLLLTRRRTRSAFKPAGSRLPHTPARPRARQRGVSARARASPGCSQGVAQPTQARVGVPHPGSSSRREGVTFPLSRPSPTGELFLEWGSRFRQGTSALISRSWGRRQAQRWGDARGKVPDWWGPRGLDDPLHTLTGLDCKKPRPGPELRASTLRRGFSENRGAGVGAWASSV